MYKVLVADDEHNIRNILDFSLHAEGFLVISALNGEDAFKLAVESDPDLILLDLMLPGIDGLEVCRRLKADPDTAHIPVVMVTAKGEETDIVTGLELGADDYVTKPFSPKVLIARMRAVQRRRGRTLVAEDDIIKIDDIVIHPGRHEVTAGSERVDLTFTEFRILHILARRPGWVFTRNQIVDSIHGEHYPVTDRAVDVHIVGLRKKLGSAGERIETVRGVGYRFKD